MRLGGEQPAWAMTGDRAPQLPDGGSSQAGRGASGAWPSAPPLLGPSGLRPGPNPPAPSSHLTLGVGGEGWVAGGCRSGPEGAKAGAALGTACTAGSGTFWMVPDGSGRFPSGPGGLHWGNPGIRWHLSAHQSWWCPCGCIKNIRA